MPETKKNIAVIGAGVAGLTAAFLLSSRHHVTIFEKNEYLGGHTNTFVLTEGSDAGIAIDTGFIVFNDRNYPTLQKLLSRLGIQGQPSDMSFSFSAEKGALEYSSYVPNGLFAQRRNLVSPSFYQMIFEILRFNRLAKTDLQDHRLKEVTLGEYLKSHDFKKSLIQNYLAPMGAAIWSTPPRKIMSFPAETFICFFNHHGLLDLQGRPHWMTIPGGSHTYVKKIRASLLGPIITNAGRLKIRRLDQSVQVTRNDHEVMHFDYVILAAHADESLSLLEDPDENEKKWLGVWNYTTNRTVLHTDATTMPKNRRAWASWNYLSNMNDPDEPASLTYHMNRLQSLKASKEYFVTLNRSEAYSEGTIIRDFNYTHPQFDFESIRSQQYLPRLNGVRRTFFCGSYFGYGFHEDAVKSAVAVARHFQIGL